MSRENQPGPQVALRPRIPGLQSGEDVNSFKELCLDVNAETDPIDRLARFWAELIGGRHETEEAYPTGDVVGDQEGMGIALCEVPESKTVKNRVHLDVSVASLEEVTSLGGTLGEAIEGWTVCQDPAGNELCAFVREGELASYRPFEIGVDCENPREIAAWWADVFGVEERNEGQPYWWITGVDGFPTAGPWFAMVFAPVPEPKTVKNRLHWDVYGDPAALIAKGATHLWDTPNWTVLADPEGNEFCVFDKMTT